jgi:hypothetical protein
MEHPNMTPDFRARCHGALQIAIGVGRNEPSGGHRLKKPCLDCLRRSAPMRGQPYWFMTPPDFTTTCPERIAP